MTKLTEPQMKILATATLLGQQGAGFTLAPDRVADRETADGLVKCGHLVAIEGVDGGDRISDELARAHAITTARKAEQAASN